MRIKIRVDEQVAAALQRADSAVRRHVGEALYRGAQEIADAATRRAPTNINTLRLSIKATQIDALSYVIRPGVDYAPYLERGTKGSQGKWPNMFALQDWVKQKLKVKDEKKSDRLAFLIGRHIKEKGIKAQPFMKPAFEEKEARVRALVKGAIARGMKEGFDGR